jgi:5-hydroxyisourate hydrolase
MSRITTHVLDTSKGRPAPGIRVVLFQEHDGSWNNLGTDDTDSDGRAGNLHASDVQIPPGLYKLRFLTKDYFALRDITTFYPYIEIVFVVKDAEHYHVPLLLTPYGYTTYRGS